MKNKILIVDDDINVLELIESVFLWIPDYIVETTDDSHAALEKCKVTDYDLILTDWMMPSMSGVDLMKRIRKLGKSSIPTFIVITGSHLEVAEGALENAGAFAVILKPFSIAEIKDIVARALEQRRITAPTSE